MKNTESKECEGVCCGGDSRLVVCGGEQWCVVVSGGGVAVYGGVLWSGVVCNGV